MKLQPNQAARAASTSNATITRTRRPARTMTSMPASAMSAAVPTSGWMATSPTGTRISTLSAPNGAQPGGSGRSCKYQAHIIGTASFISSEGWKRNSPKFSQRRAHYRGDALAGGAVQHDEPVGTDEPESHHQRTVDLQRREHPCGAEERAARA